MKSSEDGWHFCQELDTIEVLVELIQDAVNAISAAKPLGSLATAQRLKDEDAPSRQSGTFLPQQLLPPSLRRQLGLR